MCTCKTNGWTPQPSCVKDGCQYPKFQFGDVLWVKSPPPYKVIFLRDQGDGLRSVVLPSNVDLPTFINTNLLQKEKPKIKVKKTLHVTLRTFTNGSQQVFFILDPITKNTTDKDATLTWEEEE